MPLYIAFCFFYTILSKYLLYNLYVTVCIDLLLKDTIKSNLLCLPPCFVQKYRMEVGTQAMDHLINILQTDRYIYVVFVFLFGLVSVILTKKKTICTCY